MTKFYNDRLYYRVWVKRSINCLMDFCINLAEQGFREIVKMQNVLISTKNERFWRPTFWNDTVHRISVDYFSLLTAFYQQGSLTNYILAVNKGWSRNKKCCRMCRMAATRFLTETNYQVVMGNRPIRWNPSFLSTSLFCFLQETLLRLQCLPLLK